MFELTSLLPPEAFIAWGWRVPFLLSVIMLGIGFYVRLHIAETPEFEAIRELRTELPIVDLLRTHKMATLLATGARLAETVSGNMIKSFGLTYATVQLGLRPREALGALLVTAGVGMLVTPLYGVLGDRFGPARCIWPGPASRRCWPSRSSGCWSSERPRRCGWASWRPIISGRR